MPILDAPFTKRSKDSLKRQQNNPAFTRRILELLTPDIAEWKDDFLSGALLSGYQTAQGAGASALAISTPTTEVRHGRATLVTGGTDNRSSQFSLGLHWRPDNYVVMIAGVALSNIADVKIEVGFSDITATTDSADANSGAVVADLGAATATRTDGATWVYDTDDSGNAAFQGFGVANGTVATKYEPTGEFGNVDGDAVPNQDEFDYLGVALANGSARFFRGDFVDQDGNDNAKQFTITETSDWQPSFITATAPVTPYVFVQNRTNSTRTLTIDYFAVWGYRYNSDF